MNSWKVILATMVIFGTGVVTGGLLVRYSDQARAPRPAHSTPAVRTTAAGGTRLDFLRRMQRELDLTPDQRERVDHILKESQERTKKLMEPLAPELREEMQRAKEEFRNALTPQQRARFDELLKQQQHPREPRRSSPGSRS